MIDTQIQKNVLQEEKARLEMELATVARQNPSNPADWEAVPQEVGQEADENDAADLQEGYGQNAAILAELEPRYQDVLAALARIEAGSYGTCVVGGETIEVARLTADPAAKTCTTHMG